MPQPQGPSVGAAGSLTSGSASTVVTGCVIAAGSLPAGIYDVVVTTFQVGTTDTNYTNMTLERKPAGAAVALHSLPSSATPVSTYLGRVELDGNNGLQVSTGAGSPGASSVYVAVITATRLG